MKLLSKWYRGHRKHSLKLTKTLIGTMISETMHQTKGTLSSRSKVAITRDLFGVCRQSFEKESRIIGNHSSNTLRTMSLHRSLTIISVIRDQALDISKDAPGRTMQHTMPSLNMTNGDWLDTPWIPHRLLNFCNQVPVMSKADVKRVDSQQLSLTSRNSSPKRRRLRN